MVKEMITNKTIIVSDPLRFVLFGECLIFIILFITNYRGTLSLPTSGRRPLPLVTIGRRPLPLVTIGRRPLPMSTNDNRVVI